MLSLPPTHALSRRLLTRIPPQYPTAYHLYNHHCVGSAKSNCTLRSYQQSLVGTSLLIPPTEKSNSKAKKQWIACLFTSYGYGRAVDNPEEILASTRKAMEDLKTQLLERKGDDEIQDGPRDECWAVRINSGKFGVPWARSKEVLEAGGLDVTVVRREEDDDDAEEGDGDVEEPEGNGEESGEKRKRDVGGRRGKANRGSKRGRTGGGTMDGWLK